MAILISDWLKNPDYKTGVELYNHYGDNATLKKQFAKGPSVYNNNKLMLELTAINKRVVAVSKIKVERAADFARIAESKNTPVDLSQLPQDLKAKSVKKGDLYREANYHFNRIDTLTTNDQRLASANVIVRNFDEIDEIWAELDHFKATGELKSSPTELQPQTDKASLILKRNNLRSVRSKSKKNPEKYARINAEIAELEKQINEL